MTVIDDQRLKEPVDEARRRGRRGYGWYGVLARAGLVAKGVSFGIVGALAIKLAAGNGGAATSREGALEALAQETFGKVVLTLLVLGFAAYAIWRFVEALAASGDEKKKWGRRVGSVGRGLIYAALAFSAAKILLGSGGGGSQNQRAHETAAVILSWPAGTWLVGVAGVAVIGVGLWNAYRGLKRKFEKKVAHRRDGREGPPVGEPHRPRRPPRARRGLHPDRRLRDQSGAPVRPERGDRPRRRTAEAGER
ncbi:MAG TPA: DUF1206 domain-containing protein [Gaiellaceae bacterium]|nr:DUF1206 domain-containing protein [Gaiellaceae bacterium]